MLVLHISKPVASKCKSTPKDDLVNHVPPVRFSGSFSITLCPDDITRQLSDFCEDRTYDRTTLILGCTSAETRVDYLGNCSGKRRGFPTRERLLRGTAEVGTRETDASGASLPRRNGVGIPYDSPELIFELSFINVHVVFTSSLRVFC